LRPIATDFSIPVDTDDNNNNNNKPHLNPKILREEIKSKNLANT
jgi:hypothetical protein